MTEIFFAMVTASIIAAVPVLGLAAMLLPIMMITWCKSVPLQIRAPWALTAMIPLLLFYVYLRWTPAISTGTTIWLTWSLAIAAYSLAVGIAVKFRRLHVNQR